jgi:hypothetical protein
MTLGVWSSCNRASRIIGGWWLPSLVKMPVVNSRLPHSWDRLGSLHGSAAKIRPEPDRQEEARQYRAEIYIQGRLRGVCRDTASTTVSSCLIPVFVISSLLRHILMSLGSLLFLPFNPILQLSSSVHYQQWTVRYFFPRS